MSRIVKYESKHGEVLVEVDDELQYALERVSGGEKAKDALTKAAKKFDEAIEPVLANAKEVLEKVREMGPDAAEIEFGIKLAGEAGVLAKVGAEANFNVKLTWNPGSSK